MPRSKKVRKKPSGNASQLAGNDAQPGETSTTRADEVMDLTRALGYVPKRNISNPNDNNLAHRIRRLKKSGSFSRAQIEEMDALNAQGAEQARIGADEVMDLIRALGFVLRETITKNPNDRTLALRIRRLKKADRLAVRN